MTYFQLIDSCFPAAGGAALRELYDRLLCAAMREVHVLREEVEKGGAAFLDLKTHTDNIKVVENLAQRYREKFADVVLLGTGGSSLGARALCSLGEAGGPRLHFIDNIDTHTITRLFEQVELSKTGFIGVSKSGETAETLAQILITIDYLQSSYGEKSIVDHMTLITKPGDNTLRRLANPLNIRILDHDPLIGGRYSALSIVGLLPAMIVGLDPRAILAGASKSLSDAIKTEKPRDSAPASGAAISVALERQLGINTTVVMPYVDRLAAFASWYCQLWAESLGKNGLGTTPIAALGTVDQHSQLQLYLDGPADKLITILVGPMAGDGPKFDASFTSSPGLSYFTNRSLGDLMDMSGEATIETLVHHDCPVRIIRIGKMNESTLGALMMHFMLETVITARLIGVNPFDQPAVDRGKELILRRMTEL